MADAPLMIGVSGLRGVAGESLTVDVATRFAAAFGGWLVERGHPAPRVVIGSDGRLGHEVYLEAASHGLEAVGCEVTSLGVAMTPTIGVMADRLDAQGAMVVTASHNPQQWNGLKCLVRSKAGTGVVSACAPSAQDAQQIIARFHAAGDDAQAIEGATKAGNGPSKSEADRAEDSSGGEAHVALVLQSLASCAEIDAIKNARFPVVLDSVCGSGCVPGRMLLDAFGCETRHIHGEQTGVFPHTPEPLRENLTDLCDAVRASGAAVGFAQDPDADRLAIVDEHGNYIGEEYTLVLTAMALLAGNDVPKSGGQGSGGQAVVCTNLSTSRMIDDVAQRYGARVVRTAVGEANVVEAMKREAGKEVGGAANIVFGGEGNGGVIWPRVTYVRDSLGAMALTLALMARTGKTISELVAAIPAYAIEKRKTALASKADAQPACDAVAHHWAASRVDRQDGVRVDLDDERAWLHVRASNTEPIMRLIAEAPTASKAAAILDEAQRVIAAS